MTAPVAIALKILSQFWLEEIRSDDAEIITALPELAQTLPNLDSATLTKLAVEYQRLFGFNLPPYESVFIDPSAMLMTPATRRVQLLYQQGEWNPPPEARTGAPDHLGLELLALASGLETSQTESPVVSGGREVKNQVFTRHLQAQHLALWVPPFVLALHRLAPHPFYAVLGNLTLDLILSTLPDQSISANSDPFPNLPPVASYREVDELINSNSGYDLLSDAFASQPDKEVQIYEISLRDIIKQLLPPCKAGLFLTREDIACIGRALNSPGVMGERYRMLDNLFRFAGQYDLVPKLFDQLIQTLDEAGSAYQTLAIEYPTWTLYAHAWQHRLASTQSMLEELRRNSKA